MEDKKANQPSLPSNYVTLAQLQERWLKQKQQQDEGEKQQHRTQNLQQQQPHDPHQQGDRVVVVRTYGTAFRSAAGNHRAKQYRPKIQNDSGTNRRAIQVVSENHRKSEADAGIVDENADLDSKGNESNKKKKKKKVKQSLKVEKKEERGTSEAQGNKEAENSEAKKTTIMSKLDEKKNGASSVEEIQQKFGGLSLNYGNGKKNERLRRVNNGFRHSQSQRNYYGGRGYGRGRGRGYGYGYGHGHGDFKGQNDGEQKRKGDKMVWVRKDGNVCGIET